MMKLIRKLPISFLFALLILAVSFGLLHLANKSFAFANFYTRNVYSVLVEILSRFSNLFPFAISELSLYLLLMGGIFFCVKCRRKPLRAVSRLLLAASVLFLIFVLNCGINYRAGTFSQAVGLTPAAHEEGELAALCGYLTEQVGQYAATAEAVKEAGRQSEDGTAEMPGKSGAGTSVEAAAVVVLGANTITASQKQKQAAWRTAARASMQKLTLDYPILRGYYPKPKPMLLSWFLSVQQVSGIYSPYFIEAIYNRDMPDYNIPHTLCHELSHLRGFMHEDEANFISYLACIGSDDDYFRYSGYLTAWVYAGNALAAEDRSTYFALYDRLPARAKADLEENNTFWDRYEGKVSEAQDKLNDTYLKSNGQSAGIVSYNRFVELLLAYYRQ